MHEYVTYILELSVSKEDMGKSCYHDNISTKKV